MARKFVDDISVNTIVGPGAFVSGGISAPGFLKIDGDVNGDIVSKGRVVVSETARINGNIRAAAVVIGGIVKGDIIAPEGVYLHSSAIVFGAVITKFLKVEENVLLSGFCYARSDRQGFEDAEKDYKNRQVFLNSTVSGFK
ncbi:MAG: cell shape determination protein CcmA [Treponema sp.]|nr:MAG: cell shape determination protein CcmA [Treponema sp.]